MREATTSSSRWCATTSPRSLVCFKISTENVSKNLKMKHQHKFVHVNLMMFCSFLYRDVSDHDQPIWLPHVQSGSDHCGQYQWCWGVGGHWCKMSIMINLFKGYNMCMPSSGLTCTLSKLNRHQFFFPCVCRKPLTSWVSMQRRKSPSTSWLVLFFTTATWNSSRSSVRSRLSLMALRVGISFSLLKNVFE